MRCGGFACVDPVTQASSFLSRRSPDEGLGWYTEAVLCGRQHLSFRVGGRHARVLRECVFVVVFCRVCVVALANPGSVLAGSAGPASHMSVVELARPGGVLAGLCGLVSQARSGACHGFCCRFPFLSARSQAACALCELFFFYVLFFLPAPLGRQSTELTSILIRGMSVDLDTPVYLVP